MINALDKTTYLRTFQGPMRDLSPDDFLESVSVEPYVEECIRTIPLPITLDDVLINYVYGSADGHFVHVILSFGEPNVHFVVIVDTDGPSVYGHYILDLNHEYGLDGSE